MRVAVLIMATNAEPSLSNVEAMKETFMKYTNDNKTKHEYDYYIYYANESGLTNEQVKVNKVSDHIFNIEIECEESIYRTYEKTVYAFRAVNGYDWYIRINISTFINIPLLDNVLKSLDENIIYCAALNSIITDSTYLNDLYPRGDFYMMHKSMLEKIEPYFDELMYCDSAMKNRLDVTHVDDCLMGVCIIKALGKDYFNHLKMMIYNFLPHDTINNTNKFAIPNRVKTMTPEATTSGYSWDDNPYRRIDGNKMRMLNTYFKNFDYKNASISSILVDENTARPTLLVQMSNQRIPIIKAYLNRKRGV